MQHITRWGAGLAEGVLVLRRMTEALFLTVVLTALTCLLGLVLAGTFGILHDGDDFDFDIGSGGAGRGVGEGGDMIVLPGLP